MDSHPAGGSSGNSDQRPAPLPNNGSSNSLHRALSSTFSFSSFPSSAALPLVPSHRSLLRGSSISKSLQRLDSRLSVTCSGSDLGQLYLSGPEQDSIGIDIDDDGDARDGRPERRQSWLQAADLYGRRSSFRRMDSYARFLAADMMDGIDEEGEDDDERVLLIEENRGEGAGLKKRASPVRRCLRAVRSPAVVVPAMMAVDLMLGVSLSLYDSHLLRNVPGFRFPLVYALTQKSTNAVASLVLICLSRRWEAREREREQRRGQRPPPRGPPKSASATRLPSAREFKRHAVPLTAVALVQTVSAALANRALQIVPLPLFKVCLMCGPIFVALLLRLTDGQRYSAGRTAALGLIGAGACRAVYAEMEGADDPRGVATGAAHALGASAFSGIGLVLSSVLMHRGGGEGRPQDGVAAEEGGRSEHGGDATFAGDDMELNPLSLLFYLSCEQVLMLGAYLCPWDALLSQQQRLQPDVEGEMEELDEFAAFSIYFEQQPMTSISYLMTGSMISLFLAVLTFVLVNRTSPVAASLLGNVRSIATVAISSVFFDTGGGTSRGGGGAAGIFGSAALGYSCTLAGGVAYALAALRKDANAPSKS